MLLEGRYRLMRTLGVGGTAEVWSAHDEVLRRRVAVRLLRADRQAAAERFLEAGRLGARLAHPGIAAVYDVGVADLPGRGATPYIVMEFADGDRPGGPNPSGWRAAAHVAAQLADALAHAHGQWVAHGTLRAAKVVLTSVGVKLIGFGVDVATDFDAPAGDVRALGLFLAPSAGPGAPPQLAELVARCLHEDPARRPGAGEVARHLDGIAAADTAPAPEPAAVPEPVRTAGSRRWVRRTSVVAAVAAGAVLTLFTLAQAAPGAIPWFDRLPQHAGVPAPTDDACEDPPLAQRFCAPARTPSHRPQTSASPSASGSASVSASVSSSRTARPVHPNPSPSPTPTASASTGSPAPPDASASATPAPSASTTE
ncbi:hypothetical protein ABZS66_46190 [Dactylosporangium sp. NPDC005572]|uniref:hypothetical protein n=1 Tax=Dactylosporangium sp. NPDC005572 TaxID=3156889 RepID=UPI0033B58B2F